MREITNCALQRSFRQVRKRSKSRAHTCSIMCLQWNSDTHVITSATRILGNVRCASPNISVVHLPASATCILGNVRRASSNISVVHLPASKAKTSGHTGRRYGKLKNSLNITLSLTSLKNRADASKFLLSIYQSRSDDILLTVDVIYGQTEQYEFLTKSRMGRYFQCTYCVVTA